MEPTQAQVERSMELALRMATLSPDPSSQNGAVVMDRHGRCVGASCNTFPLGTTADLTQIPREEKYRLVEHAERAALYATLRIGDGLSHTLVCPWAACTECARAMVMSGVKKLVRLDPFGGPQVDRWTDSIKLGDEIMLAGGMEIVTYDGPVPDVTLLRDGKPWSP